MAKPYIHAKSSVKKYGGEIEDYLPIHDLMDNSKSAIPDYRHRALTHNAWFLFILEKIFGHTITNCDGKEVSVRDIGEDHVVEDLGFLPSAQDYLRHMTIEGWMENGKRGFPDSLQTLGFTKNKEDKNDSSKEKSEEPCTEAEKISFIDQFKKHVDKTKEEELKGSNPSEFDPDIDAENIIYDGASDWYSPDPSSIRFD